MKYCVRIYLMPARVNGIDGIMLAIEVGLLVQEGVTGNEPSNLRVVVPGYDMLIAF